MKMITTPILFLTLFFLSFGHQSTATTIRYVKSGASGTGASWASPGGYLQIIINASASGDQVWVAGGTYLAPALGLVMKQGVKIYGGFAGTETALTQRDLTITANSSTLKGDGDAVVNNNSNGLSPASLLDGFTITGGTISGIYNANTSPSFSNCIITGNSTSQNGGGVYNSFASCSFFNCTITNNNTTGTSSHGAGMYNYNGTPVLTNCCISGNYGAYYGGGIYNESSPAIITNCRITGNASTSYGSGVVNVYDAPIFTNCTIAGNYSTAGAGIDGAGMYNLSSNAIIRNSIIWYNYPVSYYSAGLTPVISYSLIQGLTSTSNGNISGTVDPLFVSPHSLAPDTTGDYHLQPCSPVVNEGSNSYYAAGQTPDLSAVTTDLDGNPRFYSTTVDMGAYERQQTTITASSFNIIFVKPNTNGTGASWSCPTSDLQAAINAAVSGNQIWVAAGTYIPIRRADNTATITTGDRNNAFVLKNGVRIYGGFTGSEILLTSRNPTANPTILSGDLNGDDNGFVNNGENAYHVVVSAGNNSATFLDGFTISGGNANGSTSITVNSHSVGTNGGGGIAATTGTTAAFSNLTVKGNAGRYGAGADAASASPSFTNCSLIANAGDYGGGIMSSSSGPSLTNVLISGNTATEQGGGLYSEWSPVPVLTNVTIAGNNAANGGGAMSNLLSVSMPIRNSIIYGNNTGILNNAGQPTIAYSLVQGETSQANGNVDGSIDPLFTSQQSPGLNAGGDYTLQPCSPAINAGSSGYYATAQSPDLSAVTTTLGNTARIQGYAPDMGVYEYAGNPAVPSQLAINGDQTARSISTTTIVNTTDASCRLIATLQPSSLSGNTTAYVWVETTQPNGYVRRHYQITPDNNPTTSTATVTLYFTQSEFDDFNAVNTIQLPSGPTDASGIANLLIEKRSGVSSDGSGSPVSYTGAVITIDPDDANIVWNSTNSRWEVTFAVAGFSGFFVKTQTTVLPLKLLSFTGRNLNENNVLSWSTSSEVNTGSFELQRSADNGSYTPIASIPAKNTAASYAYSDPVYTSGTLYYRLKMIDIDGRFTYSSIVALTNNTVGVSLFPNPASDVIYISTTVATTATIIDMTGRTLKTIGIAGGITQPFDIHDLAPGLYCIKIANGQTQRFVRK